MPQVMPLGSWSRPSAHAQTACCTSSRLILAECYEMFGSTSAFNSCTAARTLGFRGRVGFVEAAWLLQIVCRSDVLRSTGCN
jgi:hypothetical protein